MRGFAAENFALFKSNYTQLFSFSASDKNCDFKIQFVYIVSHASEDII